MTVDLHIHSKDCSDGKMSLADLFEEARRRHVTTISITDHDSIDCQESAEALAGEYGMKYISGVELNISFSHPDFRNGKGVALDVLGYDYDIHDRPLGDKLRELREYRIWRARQILEKINQVLAEEGRNTLAADDWTRLQESVDGALGRPHIANYLVEKAIVADRQQAFDRYLVQCNIPKMPLSLEAASGLIRNAGGKLVLAHPNDPRGTSLATLTSSLEEQQRIILETMLPFLDGIECHHPRHDPRTVSHYRSLAHREGLIMTGGSDCHQQPLILGTVDVPPAVAEQFGGDREER
jgi:predicted metal-dependent phosphoesterase TrpH